MKVYVGRYLTEEDNAAAQDDGGFEGYSVLNWGLFFGASEDEVIEKMKADMKADLEGSCMEEEGDVKVRSVVANREKRSMIANCEDAEGDGYHVEATFSIFEKDLSK